MNLATLTFDEAALLAAINSVDLSRIERPVCEDYSLAFGRGIENSPTLDAPLRFLAVVCGWRLRPDDAQSPFEAVWEPCNPVEVTTTHLEAVANVVVQVTDPELRARLADLVWTRARRHDFARVAAEDYFSSAARLIGLGPMVEMKSRLTRAVQIAAQLGRSGELFSSVVDRLMTLSESPSLDRCAAAECLRVMISERCGDPERLYRLAVRRAESIAQAEGNSLWERTFWDCAATFAGRLQNQEAHQTATVKVALTYEREANAAPSQAVAAHFWEMALHTYRKVPRAEEDRCRVHRRLLAAQEQIPEEMIPLRSEPIDISVQVAQSRERIRNKSKRRALAELVFATRWLPKEYLREQAEKSIMNYPLHRMFSSVRFSSTWKVAATAPAAHPDPGEIAPERLKMEMCQEYRFHIPCFAAERIEPMRGELLFGHCVVLDDIAEFVQTSPLVPPGREGFFIIGIHAGLHGRFMEAIHVLIPQLEHMLRCHLGANGTITSAIDESGIQQEFDLNRLLVMRETEAMLGADLCFTMRTVFTERDGYNLRNELSHGMLGPSACYSPQAVYSWWLIFRLIAGSYANAIIEQESTSSG